MVVEIIPGLRFISMGCSFLDNVMGRCIFRLAFCVYVLMLRAAYVDNITVVLIE